MKITRKMINIALASAAGLVVVVSAASAIGGSYASYKQYYDDLQSQRSYEEYLNSLPLEFLGITAQVKDGVNYFTNGRANPKADDFLVKAQFTEKGKESEKIIQSSDYSITVPEDFSSNGGKVTVSYTYTYEEEKKTDEAGEEEVTEPKTVTKTAEVDISLLAVKISRLVMEEQPYRVYYSDDMKFSVDGMKVKAVYNDESEKDVDLKDITIDNDGALSEGQSSAKIHYKDGEDEVSFDVPVTVVKKADYVDGNIVSIAQDGEVSLKEGEPLTSAKLNVRAQYSNGNRLIVDPSLYEVEGNITSASFMKNCILTIKMKNSSLFASTSVKVSNFVDANTFTQEGGTKKTVEAYIESSKETENVTLVENTKNISFEFNVSCISKTKFRIRLANLGAEDISLGKNVSLFVNGHEIPLDDATILPATNGTYSLLDLDLPDLVLKEGKNEVKLSVKDDKANIAVAQIEAYNKYEGEIYSSLDEYMGVVAKNNDTFDANLAQLVHWDDPRPNPYCHGLTTDGQYIYGTTTSWSQDMRRIKVFKLDPTTKQIVATSSPTGADYYEKNTGITYYDGKLVLFHSEGGQSYINVNDFVDGASFVDCADGEEILKFDGMENASIRDVYYNANYETFAVLVDKTISIFDKDMKLVTSFNPKISGAYGNISRMSGTSQYILVNYSKDGNNRPTIAVYDYSGNRIGQYQIPNSVDDMGGEESIYVPEKMNTQGITYLNGVFYFSILRFNQKNDSGTLGDAYTIMSAELKTIKENVDSKYTLGEYVEACASDYSPSTSANPVIGSNGQINTGGYHMGLASDGEYIYASKSVDGNHASNISKIDPNTWEVVEQTAAFDTLLPKTEDGKYVSDDNSQLFVKDGKVYTILYPGDSKCKVVSIPTDAIAGKLPTEDTLPFEDKTNKRVRSVYYSEITSQYAVIDDSKSLYFFDEDGNQVNSTISLKGYSNWPAASITGDNKYIYVSYRATNQATLPIEIYTLSGDYVGISSTSGIKLGENNFNIQSIVSHNNEMYVGPCTWEGSHGTYIWKIDTDSNVFPTSKLDRIEVTCDTNRFIIGENIRNHIKVVAYYEDGTKEKVTDFTLDKETFTSESDTSFTVSYKKGTVVKTFDVTGLTVTNGSLFGDIYSMNPSLSLSFASQSIDSSITQYLMGGTYHDGYIYLASSAGGSHTPTTVRKIDSTNFKVVASKTISNASYSSDGSQLFVKGNDLYLITGVQNGEEMWKIDLTNDFTSSDKQFEKVSFPIVGATGIQFNEYNNQYAALIGGKVKTYDEAGNELKTFSQGASASGYGSSSIFVDDEYIYVSFKVNGQKQVPILIYRWDGSYVGRVNITMPTDLADTSYNIQSVFIKGNTLYGVVCTWGKVGGIILEAQFA